METGDKLALSKLKVMYIFNKFDVPISNSELTSFVLENELMDYFALQEVITELYKSKYIDIYLKNGKELYYLTDESLNTLEIFKNMLPKYFTDDVNSKFVEIKKALERKNDLFAHYYKKKDDEYVVSFQVLENRVSIFSLSINVPDEKMAKSVCDKWNSNPEEIFGSIYKTLTSDLQ